MLFRSHVTVAHAMGSTIGINTMILFASLYYIFEMNEGDVQNRKTKIGFWVVNISLLVFWVTLIMSGIVKAIENDRGTTFQKMMLQLQPWFKSLNSAGLGIFVGVVLLSIPLLTKFKRSILSTDKLLSKKRKV